MTDHPHVNELFDLNGKLAIVTGASSGLGESFTRVLVSAGATVVHYRYRIVSSGERPYESEAEVVTTGPYARPDILADQT
jgi:NAD(P)-dependent dehydrogenase (short-subunit alcohol dehydrogenase family)